LPTAAAAVAADFISFSRSAFSARAFHMPLKCRSQPKLGLLLWQHRKNLSCSRSWQNDNTPATGTTRIPQEKKKKKTRQRGETHTKNNKTKATTATIITTPQNNTKQSYRIFMTI